VPEADDELVRLLGTQPPESISALNGPARAELVAVLRESRQRQQRGLEDAFATALRHVPFPVRGIVKKVLLG
jgi:hypothetical protein